MRKNLTLHNIGFQQDTIYAIKNSFKKRWGSLSQIGRSFDLLAIKVGKILKEHGLRDKNGTPSNRAIKENLCISTPYE